MGVGIRAVHPSLKRLVSLGAILVLTAATQILPLPVSATGTPPSPGSNTMPGGPQPDALIPVDASGFSGSSQTSDTVNGWGDDQWQINFPQAVSVTISVTDCCIVGDNYEVYIDGNLIGTTPQEPLFGPTYSSGSFTQTVPAGTHLITIRDPGGIFYFNQGNTFMIPAGYFVTITIAPTHPIIFVHGIGEHSHAVGGQDLFQPLITDLQNVYGQVQKFDYVDDRSFTDNGGTCPLTFAPCDSQSAIVDNAVALATIVTNQFNLTNHKVALIGYSMGAAIIRSVLAGCPTLFGSPQCPGVAAMVDNVFFINGVQQGSYLLALNAGLNIARLFPGAIGKYASILSRLALIAAQLGLQLNLNDPAEADLTPLSLNILAQDQVPVPHGIRYFNFFGDIQVTLQLKIFKFQLQVGPGHFGDFVLLPGGDNPQQLQLGGGAEFCLNCVDQGGYRFNQLDSTTSFTEWPLTDPRLIVIGSSLSTNLFNSFPEWHVGITHDDSLNGVAIHVQDTSGKASGQTGIAQEILYQLEKGDGL